MSLCLFLEIPLFYCLQTIENNRKSIGTIDFRFFLHTIKKYHHFMSTDQIWCYFMDDSILFEIYGKYMGFADFKVPTFTKKSIFSNGCFYDLETSQKNVK